MSDRNERKDDLEQAKANHPDERAERGIANPAAGLDPDVREYIETRDETFDGDGQRASVGGRVHRVRRKQGGRGGDSGMRE